MKRWRGRVAVVTGASSGIGAAIAYQLQDAGIDVVGLAPNAEDIPESVLKARVEAESRGIQVTGKAPTPGSLYFYKCDVTKEEEIKNAFKWVKENTKGVDILVNCAGVPGTSSLTDNDTEGWRKLLEINLLGLCICTREAIQQMRDRGVDDGHVVHISSGAADTSPVEPRHSMYYASKHGVRVVTEGLRKELVATNSKIRVTEVRPGYVKTNLLNNLKGTTPEEFWKRPHLKPEAIADAVVYALGVPPHVQIHMLGVKNVEDPM